MIRAWVLVACFVSVAAGAFADDGAGRPNIVVVLADDFGVGDIQAHYPDNKIATPSLDRLVRQAMSFTDAHSPSAVCSPTRYGLLTGRLARDLSMLVDSGTSRRGQQASNDTVVRMETTQTERWAPEK